MCAAPLFSAVAARGAMELAIYQAIHELGLSFDLIVGRSLRQSAAQLPDLAGQQIPLRSRPLSESGCRHAYRRATISTRCRPARLPPQRRADPGRLRAKPGGAGNARRECSGSNRGNLYATRVVVSAMQPKPLSRRGAFTVLAAFGASAADSTDQTSPMRLSFLSNELAPADQVLRRQCAVSLATAAQLPGGSQTAARFPCNRL